MESVDYGAEFLGAEERGLLWSFMNASGRSNQSNPNLCYTLRV